MSSKIHGPTSSRYSIIYRIPFVVFGCVTVIWGAVNFPVFWRQTSIELTANNIITGAPYKIETLMGQMPIVEATEKLERCHPRALWSAAIIRLRIVEQANSGGAEKSIDVQKFKSSLDNSIRGSLSCSPADPFLWLALYSTEVTKNGFDPSSLNYLRMSYRLGPNEGWVALRRNRVALTVYDQLPNDLAQSATNEFVELVGSNFYNEAVDILVGPGWKMHERLLQALNQLEVNHRRTFARTLHQRGYDLAVPGIKPPDSRPWH